jgi:hypothetical protein
VGEPYVKRDIEKGFVRFVKTEAILLCEAKGLILSYWLVRENTANPEVLFYVKEDAKDFLVRDPVFELITKEVAQEILFSSYPVLLNFEEAEGKLRILVTSPYLAETVVKNSAGEELGRGISEILIKKPLKSEIFFVSLFGLEKSFTYKAPPLPEPVLTVTQENSSFVLSVLNLAGRSYDLYACDATASVVDFTSANLIAKGLTTSFSEALEPGDKRIAKADVEGTSTNQVYYALREA